MLFSIAGSCRGGKERKMRQINLTWGQGWKISVYAFSKLFPSSLLEKQFFYIPYKIKYHCLDHCKLAVQELC